MRYALISDVHSNIVALKSVLNDLEDKEYDKLVCLGDIIGYGPKPKECLDEVRENADIIIQGNHDRMVNEKFMSSGLPKRVKKGLKHSQENLNKSDLEWLDQLSDKKKVDDDLYIAHSHPTIVDKYVYPRNFKRMITHMKDRSVTNLALGHTHVQANRSKSESDMTYKILNPGSVGQPRDSNPKSAYSILDTEQSKVNEYRVSYDISKVVSQVKIENTLPNKNGYRLKKGD